MTSLADQELLQLASRVLARRMTLGEDADVIRAAGRAYEELAGVLVSLIGQGGVDALVARALHLAQRNPLWKSMGKPGSRSESMTEMTNWLQLLEPEMAAEAAAAFLSTLTGLLITFIGAPLTTRFMRKAWPDCFSDLRTEETK